MKHTLFILALITASIQTFAQSPRIKLNQITKDSLAGSVLISSPTDSGMVYSRDLFISYGADTFLILGGDTLAATSSIISSVLSDGVTITGDGTSGSELTVDTATVVATKQDLDLYYLDSNPDGYTSNTGTVTSVGGTGTVNGISLSGSVTSSGNLTLGGTLSNVNLASQVTGTLPIANGGTGSATQNFVDLTNAQTVGGAKTFTSALSQSGGDVNFDSGTFFVDESANNVGIGTSSPTQYLEILGNGTTDTKFLVDGNGCQGTTPEGCLTDLNIRRAAGRGLSIGILSDSMTAPADYVESNVSGANQMRLKTGSGIDGINFTTGKNAASIRFIQQTTPRLIINSGGEILIGYESDEDNGNYRLQVQDSVYVGGNVSANAYTTRSDIRLKQNITEYQNGLNDVMSLYPVYFYQKEYPSKQRLGFIAQDVRNIIPQAITDNEQDDYLGIEYSAFSAVLVKAIQEQQTIIETQATEIEQLKQLITDLSNRLQILENN